MSFLSSFESNQNKAKNNIKQLKGLTVVVHTHACKDNLFSIYSVQSFSEDESVVKSSVTKILSIRVCLSLHDPPCLILLLYFIYMFELTNTMNQRLSSLEKRAHRIIMRNSCAEPINNDGRGKTNIYFTTIEQLF